MYVAKFSRRKLRLAASLFEKEWSEDILSNRITIISTKNFLTRASANRWINSEIRKHMFLRKRLEIIDG